MILAGEVPPGRCNRGSSKAHQGRRKRCARQARPQGRNRNVYAKTREECEEKLKALIKAMQAERKQLLDQQRGIAPPDQLTKKQKQIWQYLRFHPNETNMSAIARGAGVNRHTAAKHYELIREMVGERHV